MASTYNFEFLCKVGCILDLEQNIVHEGGAIEGQETAFFSFTKLFECFVIFGVDMCYISGGNGISVLF